MAATKENMTPSRLTVGSSQSPYSRQQPRTHSHSLSVGSINPTSRIGRRKSSSSHASSAAVAAAVNIAAANMPDGANGPSKRSGRASSKSSFPSSLPAASGFGHPAFEPRNSSVLTDGPPLSSLPETIKANAKSRARRASEGSRLSKGEGKRQASGELKCETCGKGYKHSSCLYKHLWEHTPEWAYTSKLLISKHQQVQLLEAASVLVAMNHDAVESDTSSPEGSGSSDVSSSETSPPPQPDELPHSGTRADSKRFSSNSSVYSQSYQSSIFSETGGAHSSRPYMSHYRQWSASDAARPTTSGTSVTESYVDSDDHADLAGALNLLSCSYGNGTPKTGPVMLPADAPPVPPLPAQFLGQKADHLSGSTIRGYDSYVRGHRDMGADADVDMMDEDDEDRGHGHGGTRSDEEEEGMFGKMEE